MGSDLSASYFLLIWGVIVFAFPVAVVCFIQIRKRRPRSLRSVVLWCIGGLFIVIHLPLSGTSFIGIFPNIVLFALSYVAYCFLTVACWRMNFKVLRVPAIICMGAPIVLGYVLGTVGLLVLGVGAMNIASPPYKTQSMGAGLECRGKLWGFAAADSGYTLSLYKRWPFLPILESKLASISVNQTQQQETDQKDATCEDLIREVQGRLYNRRKEGTGGVHN